MIHVMHHTATEPTKARKSSSSRHVIHPISESQKLKNVLRSTAAMWTVRTLKS